MPKFPGIPEPTGTVQGLLNTVGPLKEAVEMMAGQRGDMVTSVVTWGDLVRLGLIKEDQMPR